MNIFFDVLIDIRIDDSWVSADVDFVFELFILVD